MNGTGAAGFLVNRYDYSPDGNEVRWEVAVPYWIICVAFVALTARAAHTRALRSQRSDSNCIRCGYDLRASKERCPECGTQITAVSQQRF